MGLILSSYVATKLILAEPVVQQFIVTTTKEIEGISNILMKEVENAHIIRQEQNNILANILLLGICGFGIAWVTNKIIGLWPRPLQTTKFGEA